MAELYRKIFELDNIELAIIETLKDKNSNIAGPDGITKQNLMNNNGMIIHKEKVIKEIKMRLRRCKKINSRIDNNQIIMNLYDRIAHQAVYQIIYPIIKLRISKYNYGFDKDASIKIPISKIVAGISNTKYVYTIQIDFNKCLNNISLEQTIGMAKKLGVTNSKLLKTIKHLMYFSEEYINIKYNTLLGTILINCFLHQIDIWIENNVDTNHRNSSDIDGFKAHKNNFAEWLKSRGCKCHGVYYRYASNIIIVCLSRNEQLNIYNELEKYINEELKINLNKKNIKTSYNCFDFLGFHIKKIKDKVLNKSYINITPSDVNKLRKEIKSLTFRSGIACIKSIKIIIDLMNHYDICNNLEWMIKHINDRMYRHTLRHGSNIKCIREKNKERRYTFIYKGRQYNVSPWEIRRKTKQSCKNYMMYSSWLVLKDKINEIDINHIQLYFFEKTILWIKQKGKDYCTGMLMNPKRIHIHHLNGNHNDNRWNNLILVTPETHKQIHSIEKIENRRILKCRKALKS